MASGNYVQKSQQTTYITPSRVCAGGYRRMALGGFRFQLWMLWVFIIPFFIYVFSIGILRPVSTTAYVTTSEQYSMQVGDTKAGSWQYPVNFANPSQMAIPRTSKTHATVASQALVRINQTDTSQYLTQGQHDQWFASSCSAAAMTMAINAYGHQYRIGNILEVEATIGAISPFQGLLEPKGIDNTAWRFGFQTQTLDHPSLDDVLNVANKGKPVLINFPPQSGTVWAGGHFLVLRGGTPDAVQLADSSSANGGNGLQIVDKSYMAKYWRGFAKVLAPVDYSVASDTPSLTVEFINKVLSAYHSPASDKGQALYDLGVQYGIDPGFALSFFLHESTMGKRGEATKSLSLGNLRCISNHRCEDNFAQFDRWEDGFKSWYQLIRNLYITEWGLVTPDQIIPKYAPSADNNNEQAYIAALKHAIDTWKTGQVIV